MKPGIAVLIISFSGTYIIYSLNILRLNQKHICRHVSDRIKTTSENYKLVERLVLAAAISLFPACFFLKKGTLLMLVFLGLLSLLYSVPLFKVRNEWINMRKIPGVKSFLISFVWIMSTIWIPLYESGLASNTIPVYFVYAGRFLFIFSVCLAFDIRDMDQDSRNKLYTIPVMIGKLRSKILIGFMMIINACMLYLNAGKFFYGHRLALLTGILVYLFLVAVSNRKRNEYFYHFWLDGILIFQYLLVLLF